MEAGVVLALGSYSQTRNVHIKYGFTNSEPSQKSDNYRLQRQALPRVNYGYLAWSLEIGHFRESMDPRWYAAKTKPRQESVALLNLARQEFETYLPHVTIERIRGKRISVEREPLFPGYVLIKFALATASWRAINSTRGITSLLIFGENGIPTPLPTREVETIQRREISGQLFISEVKKVHRGDNVRIKFGDAAEAIGSVIFTRGERLELLLNLLGRQTRVRVPLHAVEVVDSHRQMQSHRPVR